MLNYKIDKKTNYIFLKIIKTGNELTLCTR